MCHFFLLQELTFLTELNLSYNEIRNLTEFPFRLPSVSKLNLAGNGIQNISGKNHLERSVLQTFSINSISLKTNS